MDDATSHGVVLDKPVLKIESQALDNSVLSSLFSTTLSLQTSAAGLLAGVAR